MANFKGYKRSIKLGFDYDEVRQGIPNVKKQMAILNAEFRKTTEEIKVNGNQFDKLGSQYDYLSERIKIQKQEVEEYKKKLDDATKANGNNSKSVMNNTVELRKAEARLAETQSRLERVNEQISYQDTILDKNSDEWKDLEYQLELTKEEYRKTSAEIENSENKTKKLQKEHEFLNETLKTQQRQVEMYKDKLKETSAAENTNEDAVKKNRLELIRAEAAMAETQASISRVSKELDNQKSVLEESRKKWEQLSNDLDKKGKAMSIGVTAPLVAAGGLAFKMAADYEQALGKMETVFEDNSNTIEKWAKGSMENFGLAKSTATTLASDYGALFKGMGISIDKTSKWSMTLTERVMDLSNFYDTTVEETTRALETIVTGQTEPLRRFGINMTQATLQEFALSQGIKKKISDMTEAEKVQLRYNFVIERTNIAVGTTAREADTATGQMNRFKEIIKELGQNFGDILLPMIIPFIETLNSVLLTFNSLDDGTKVVIVRMLAFAATIGPTLILLSKLIATVKSVSEGFGKVTKMLGNVKKAGGALELLSSSTEGFGMLKLIGYALALAAAFAVVALSFDLIFRGGKGVQGMMDSIGGAFGKQTNQIHQSIGNAGRIPGYARGTANHPGGYAIVGEEGPELVNLPRGSSVNTASETKDILSGGDTFILQVNLDEVDEVNKLMNVFKQLKQTKRVMG